jgi:hypothetical protein
MKKLLLILTILSLSVNADPVEDVWDWANDNPIAVEAPISYSEPRANAFDSPSVASGIK